MTIGQLRLRDSPLSLTLEQYYKDHKDKIEINERYPDPAGAGQNKDYLQCGCNGCIEVTEEVFNELLKGAENELRFNSEGSIKEQTSG